MAKSNATRTQPLTYAPEEVEALDILEIASNAGAYRNTVDDVS